MAAALSPVLLVRVAGGDIHITQYVQWCILHKDIRTEYFEIIGHVYQFYSPSRVCVLHRGHQDELIDKHSGNPCILYMSWHLCTCVLCAMNLVLAMQGDQLGLNQL